jgi:hypothetical protein
VPKVSWLKKFGQVMGKILGFVGNDAAKIANIAAPVAETLLPQFASEIQAADNLVTNIAKQAIVTEAVAQTASTAVTGPQKLEAVLTNSGPEIDAWVASAFPGAKTVSNVAKSGLINAVVQILNEVDPSAATPAATAVASAPAKS